MSRILDLIKKKRIFMDGGMGSLLQARGLNPGEPSENWNIEHPQDIIDIHRQYLDAGTNVIQANTFRVNPFNHEDYEEQAKAAMYCAKEAIKGYEDAFIAFDIGPTGKLIKPMGTLDFEDAVKAFGKMAAIAENLDADLIIIETMNDSLETKAALLGCKENCSLPIFVTNAYDERGKLMTGADPAAMTAMLESMGADAIGMNCSVGPDLMLPVVKEMCKLASVPVIVSPNAGLPRVEDGNTVYDVSPEDFAEVMAQIAEEGACILGGCCGTTPEYIKAVCERVKDIPYRYPEKKNDTLISSFSHAVKIGERSLLIGERINPTGKKKIKEALKNEDYGYILKEGLSQEEKGVHILDVNAGLPGIEEAVVLKKLVYELQAVSDIPLQIDTSDEKALEEALRIYNGKALVNSVTGALDSMEKVFPLVRKYGGAVIGLTMDESGIPATAEGRYEIAEKIVKTAAEYGIDKKDIIIDPLAMTVSSDGNSANVTLQAIRLIKAGLGVSTSLGVSNISFGLPKRSLINQAFYTMALYEGLDLAIMNPDSNEMMNAYYAFNAVRGIDESCLEYIGYAEGIEDVKAEKKSEITLSYAIEKGMDEEAGHLAEELCREMKPLEIIDNYLIPALNKAGEAFEKKTIFLPQLIKTAEAAGKAFDALKGHMPVEEGNKDRIVLATVKGDIHDIGKNIVKALLESYGFFVDDLGKDVEPEAVLNAARGCRLVGLSALMTTTVPAMEETIRLIRESLPEVKIVVGGAVLTKDYADEIGADYYGKDAMDTVRAAEEVFGR